MSICTNFEGALMKAIRSLEQHVDSLMSYEFGHLTDEELMQVLHRVDDRRIFVIAEAIRRNNQGPGNHSMGAALEKALEKQDS